MFSSLSYLQVEVTDQLASNGVIHVIDDLLLSPDRTIEQYLEDSPDHRILYSLFNKYRVYFQFQFTGATFFAPFDHAFQQMPQSFLQELYADPLRAIVSVKCFFLTVLSYVIIHHTSIFLLRTTNHYVTLIICTHHKNCDILNI